MPYQEQTATRMSLLNDPVSPPRPGRVQTKDTLQYPPNAGPLLAATMDGLSEINTLSERLPDNFQMDWEPISTAPFDRDLQLAVIDAGRIHMLVFPCRRVLRGWIKATTSETVLVRPTHWREWKDAATPSSGSASAGQQVSVLPLPTRPR
jgi:hypothetical protein